MKGAMILEPKYVRFMTKRQAADYSGMSLLEFARECPVLPEARAQGRKVYDVYKLDRWLDGDKKADTQETMDAINAI